MASRVRTPSPSPCVREPPAPRLGFHDDWQPFAPRKSARIADRTPSPRAARKASSPQPSAAKPSASRASMVSPMQSPRKRSRPHDAAESCHGSSSTANNVTSVTNASGVDYSKTPRKTVATRSVGMLPTPSKTPQKPQSTEASSEISSFANRLFQSSNTEIMPSNKRRGPKKYSGLTLESFTAEIAEDPIEIFTDSKDRVPEVDNSLENPFYGQASSPPVTRSSKRRNVTVPGEKRQSVEELVERDDGMTYVFRGKRVFRKFAPEQSSDGLTSNVMPSRSSIKPRLLFPTKPQPHAAADEIDEEAATDIEEGNEDLLDDELEMPQTPAKSKAKDAATPSAPRFAPVSPPDTRRTTRSTNKLYDEPEMTPVKKKTRRSVFDSWPRTKDQKSTGTKREGEPLGAPPPKKTKV